MLGLLKRQKKEGIKEKESLETDKEKPSRRKKKDSPKPWGKKERYLVLVILLFTVITSALLALQARNWKLPGLPKIKLPKVSLFKGETIVIGKKEVSPIQQERIDRTKQEFTTLTKPYSGTYALFVYDLNEDVGFGINKKESMQAASLIKLPVMIALYQEEENGSLSLSKKYKLKNEDKVGGAGSLQGKPEGYELSYRDLLRLMGKQSDNTAYKIAVGILGDEKIQTTIDGIGMNNTIFTNNETTAEDMGLLLAKLFQGELVNNKNKEELLSFLTDTVYEEWLTAGLPDDIQFAHKYGRETHVVNDAGVVFSEDPFVLVVMTKGVIEREADEMFPRLSELVYQRIID